MTLNITKKTGDQFTADEFNQVIGEINNKADQSSIPSISGLATTASVMLKADKSDVYTRQEVDSKLAGISENIISANELQVGVFKLGSESHDIFERSFELNGLPKTAGMTSEFLLSDEPLGYGLYMNVENFSVSTGKKMKSEFFPNMYEIVKVYVDDTLKTRIIIKCKETTTLDFNAVLRLTYCKFFGDKITLEVTLPSGINASAVNLEFPRLKYNKKLVFSWINDDSCSIWNNIFCLVNKKYVSNEIGTDPWQHKPNWSFGFHYGMSQGIYDSSGEIPDKALEYTDGTGVKHRFATTVATWVDKLYDQDPEDRDALYGPAMPWNSALEARIMFDFGFTIGWHDVFNTGDVRNREIFNKRISEKSAEFKRLTGIIPKAMIEPNGEHDYIDYSILNPLLQFIIAQGGDNHVKTVYPFKEGFSLDKRNVTIQRIFAYGTDDEYVDDLMTRLQDARSRTDLSLVPWLIGSGHQCSKTLDSTLLRRIEAVYGASGDDSIWFPSVDEFFEYWFITSLATVVKDISGQKVKFTIYLPTSENFWFKSVSCLLSGITSIEGVTIVSSDNCNGESYAINDGKLLVNLDFNPGLLDKVERYVSEYESTGDIFDKEDASYLVQLLKSELQDSFWERLNANLKELSLNSISVNGGVVSTTK